MKKFHYKILIFGLLTIGLAYLMDYCIELGFKKTELRLFKSWNKILSGGVNADMVVIGNSRAYRHFDPQILGNELKIKFYNLGMDGYTFGFQMCKYDIYRKANKKPKTILISVDHATLYFHRITANPEQFLPYLGSEAFENTLIKESFSWKEKYLPLYKYQGLKIQIPVALIEAMNLRHFTENEIDGYWQEDIKWDGVELAKSLETHSIIKQDVNPEELKMLEDFIESQKAEGINVILVWTPIYVEGLKVLVDNKKERHFYKELASKHEISYLDYSDDPICLDTANFTNFSHLNATGVKIFNKKLINDLQMILK